MGTRRKRATKSADSGARSAGALLDALFPKTRQRVMGLLFGQPQRSFGKTELIRLAASGSGAVRRELDRLVASGLVSVVEGRPQAYRANSSATIFEELVRIVEKTSGVPHALRTALTPLASKISLAILYGSIAKSSDTATSDIDLLLVADDLSLEEVFAAIQPAEERLSRRVSPTVYTREEFRRRRESGNAFLTKVLSGKHVILLGTHDAVSAAR